MMVDLPAYATLSTQGEIARKLGHPNASDLLEAARHEALELHLPHVTSAAPRQPRVCCTRIRENGVEAERCLAHAEDIAHTIGDIDTQLDAMLGRAKNWLSTAHYRLAMPKLEEALHLAVPTTGLRRPSMPTCSWLVV